MRARWLLGLASVLGCTSSPAASPDGGPADGGGTSTRDATVHTAPDGGPPQLRDCAGLAAVGTFEDITPPELTASGESAFAIATDPSRQGVVYVGSVNAGFYKSEDCGASWVRVATGMNGEAIDSAMSWSITVDPTDSNRVYVAAGYAEGAVSGLYRSQNGGTDWTAIWPPAGQPELHGIVDYEFANVMSMDPDDPTHLLLTFHANCHLPPDTEAARVCFAESFDRGDSWRLLPGIPEWSGWEGQHLLFLERNRWLYTSQENGSWVLTVADDGRYTADPIEGLVGSHLQGTGFVRSRSGRFFVAGNDAVWSSASGNPTDWSPAEDTGPILGGIVDTPSGIYTTNCYFPGFCTPSLLRSTDDGQTWAHTDLPAGVDMGGALAYDAGHGLVFFSGGTHVLRYRAE